MPVPILRTKKGWTAFMPEHNCAKFNKTAGNFDGLFTLHRFVLMVKKGYRDPPYHNWSHAFSVAHFCYTLFKNCGGLSGVLSDLEVLALFVSCLCHDIDHRGTNNAFQVSSVSGCGCLWVESNNYYCWCMKQCEYCGQC